MKTFITLAALLQVALGSGSSFVSVRMPYTNPAGVTYVNGYQGHEFSQTYAAGAYAAPATAYQAAPVVAQPAYQGPVYSPNAYATYQNSYPAYRAYAAAIPAKVEAHHVGYAAAQVPAVAAVPFVKHVPTVSHIPVTRYEAHPAVIEKQVDVAKPAVSTRKFEVRRPAIQKQFYDIEERVIVRPAGSAVVELDEPTSKLQRGPAVVQPLEGHYTHNLIGHSASFGTLASPVTVAPVFAQPSVPQFQPSTTPASVFADGNQGASQSEDDQSVTVDNPDFRSRLSSQDSLFRPAGQYEPAASRSQEKAQQEYYQNLRNEQSSSLTRQSQVTSVEIKSNGEQQQNSFSPKFRDANQGPSLIPSVRGSAEEGRSNQQKLIDLLTARGGVAEVGFGRSGVSSSLLSDAGHVRARVISATPAPDYAEPTGERVSTRRVVVSRPIETLQEVDVQEPATKFERISVQHPTLIKTARLDHIQVHGSVPVYGKALAPAVAHAAVPVYQKTISPAYY